ncbi:DUF2497 domain-containing protein [Bartonella sp. CB189]|uniref:DUF2497 domain-containing protein n=1 Tax=Bartonella sp. CB189 TaxID=3112254 RepID=UPI002F960A37
MVQSSSVLREPSMDEILTSIREIIEENTVHPDYLSNESIAANASTESSAMQSDNVDAATLSVDDAMKALADRIGLSSERQNFSSMQVQENVQVQESAKEKNDTVGRDMQNIKFSSGEQRSVHKANEYSGEPFVAQPDNMAAGGVELSAYCVSSAEKIAKDVLRPAIAEWLQCKLPGLLENILREEIVKALKKLP